MHGPDAMALAAAETQGTERQSSSALAALRAATQSAHAALEAQVPLLGPSLSLPLYTAYLSALLPLVEPLEGLLDRRSLVFAALGFDWPRRRRIGLLKSDVATLTERIGASELARGSAPAWRPSVARLSALDTPGGRIGVLYVLEGSTLGGLLLHRHLRERLGAHEAETRYLSGHGAQTGRLWRETCRFIESTLRSPSQQHEASVAARATFTLFSTAIARMAVPS